MFLKLEPILAIVAAVFGVVALAVSSALAGGVEQPPISVAEPVSIAAFVSGLAALYAVKKCRKSK